MININNPLDPSKDGQNPFLDGISIHIRNSKAILEEVMNNPEKVMRTIDYIQNAYDTYLSPVKALDYVLKAFGYKAEDLIIADEHRLIDWLYQFVD